MSPPSLEGLTRKTCRLRHIRVDTPVAVES
jgi:hypothetical protein